MIPHKIHQIWVGPRPPPIHAMESWKTFCKENDWDYNLWSDKEIEEIGKNQWLNWDIYLSDITYHGRSDLLRLEILANYGGVYLDCDVHLKKPEIFLDIIESPHSGFILCQDVPSGWVPAWDSLVASTAFIASSVDHPNIKHLINIYGQYWTQKMYLPVSQRGGPFFVSRNLIAPFTLLPWRYIFPRDYHPDKPFIVPSDIYDSTMCLVESSDESNLGNLATYHGIDKTFAVPIENEKSRVNALLRNVERWAKNDIDVLNTVFRIALEYEIRNQFELAIHTLEKIINWKEVPPPEWLIRISLIAQYVDEMQDTGRKYLNLLLTSERYKKYCNKNIQQLKKIALFYGLNK